jgi:hypothetical protein
MKTILTILSLIAAASYGFAAAPETVTITLSAQDKVGLEHVTSVYNAEAKAKHDATESSKPEVERVAYVPITEEAYAKLRLADVFKSWTAVYTQYRMSLPENIEFFQKATLLTEEQKAQLKTLIDAQVPK